MSDFKIFQDKVKALCGVWASEDTYFTQTRDEYCAEYRPCYPEHTNRDMIIKDIRRTGAYLRGNYELVRFWDGKVQAFYYEELDGTTKTAE
jgi:hypothetical protein